jgi:hypothetical protein
MACLPVHLTAEQFVVLSDMRVNGETIRISQRFADLSYLNVFALCSQFNPPR